MNNFRFKWDRAVFIGSIIGLLFLGFIVFFKYYYLIPAQSDISVINKELHKLKVENRQLKNQIKKLQKYEEYN